jgi:hypothetical protein
MQYKKTTKKSKNKQTKTQTTTNKQNSDLNHFLMSSAGFLKVLQYSVEHRVSTGCPAQPLHDVTFQRNVALLTVVNVALLR